VLGRLEIQKKEDPQTAGNHRRAARGGFSVMGRRLPALKPREMVRALERMGFHLIRKSKGSHWQFEHPDGRRTTIPCHKSQDIGPGLLRKILRDIEVEANELSKWL
jgi:predicted RNA binding protein YcfA (HicA-like mRNA interferase family)